MPERRSWAALASELLGILAVVAVAFGAAAASFEWIPGFVGFRIFLLGLLLGLVTLVLAIVGLLRTRAGSSRTGRGRAAIGAGIGGVLTVLLFVLAAPGRNLPPINDITTDLSDPPAFEASAQLPANRSRDMSHPGEAFAAQQRKGYPDLAPLERPTPPAETFAAVLAAVESLGWTVVAQDPARGRIEAWEETSFFHLVDDVVIRIRPGPGGGSTIDVRSKSRDGRGDIGANAARIRRLFDEL